MFLFFISGINVQREIVQVFHKNLNFFNLIYEDLIMKKNLIVSFLMILFATVAAIAQIQMPTIF